MNAPKLNSGFVLFNLNVCVKLALVNLLDNLAGEEVSLENFPSVACLVSSLKSLYFGLITLILGMNLLKKALK